MNDAALVSGGQCIRYRQRNSQWLAEYAGDHKKGARTIKTVDDFAGEELGEHKVLKIARETGETWFWVTVLSELVVPATVVAPLAESFMP